MRTCVPMTSQGSALGRLRRALASGNATLALAAAAELPRVPLEDALALVLLLRDDEARFDRAVVRWHARLCLEVQDIGPSEALVAPGGAEEPVRAGREGGGGGPGRALRVPRDACGGGRSS